MHGRTTVRWTLGLMIGLVTVALLAATATAQTPTATPTAAAATATATPTVATTAPTTATATATATPAPASTGNAGLFTAGGTPVLGIALLAVLATAVVLGGRELARRRP